MPAARQADLLAFSSTCLFGSCPPTFLGSWHCCTVSAAAAWQAPASLHGPTAQASLAHKWALSRACPEEHDIRPSSPALCTLQASGFGPLKEGFLTSVNTHFSRTLLSRPPCPVLEALARHLQYEVAVGLNGRVWVNADSPTKIILVTNAISNSEFLTPAQTETLVAKLAEVSVTDLLWGAKPACSGSCAISSSRLQPSQGSGLGGYGEL